LIALCCQKRVFFFFKKKKKRKEKKRIPTHPPNPPAFAYVNIGSWPRDTNIANPELQLPGFSEGEKGDSRARITPR
jgi:hypothetical protein